MALYASQTITEYPIAGAPVVSNICVSSATGEIFATLETLGQIAKISPGGPDGKLSLIPLPQNGTFGGINPGSDGRIWYTDQQNLQICALNPVTGSVAQFNIPTQPAGIVCGSDGNMWSTFTASKQIVMISPQGSITTFSGLSSGPHGPNLGWDGNVWFCEGTASKVGYITPQGTIVESGVMPTSGAFVINRGADGNMWFTKPGVGKISRVTTQGMAFTEFTLPNGGSPGGICPGVDGNVYFSEQANSAIGRISPFGAPSQTGTIQNVASFTTGGSHALQVTLPATVAASDVVLCYAHSNNASAAITGPQGFSQIGAQVYGINVTMAAYYTALAAPSTVTVGASTTAGVFAMELYDIAGSLGAAAIDTFATVSTPSTTSIALGPASPTSQNTMAIAAVGVTGNGVGNTSFNNAWTGGFAQDGTQDSHEEWAHLTQMGSGSQISTTETIAAARNSVGFLTLLKMQPGAATPQIVERAIPTANALPDKIVCGSDGRVWFCERGAGKIAAMDLRQWFTYNGPFDAEIMAGEEYPTVLRLGPTSPSVCAAPVLASQLAAGDQGWFTFH